MSFIGHVRLAIREAIGFPLAGAPAAAYDPVSLLQKVLAQVVSDASPGTSNQCDPRLVGRTHFMPQSHGLDAAALSAQRPHRALGEIRFAAAEEGPSDAQSEVPTLHGNLKLSLADAVAMGIENNLDLQVFRAADPHERPAGSGPTSSRCDPVSRRSSRRRRA